MPSKKTLLKFAYSHSVEHTIDLLIFVIFLKDKVNLKLIKEKIAFLENTEMPVFPIKSDFLKSQYGFSESKELGIALKKLKDHWISKDFQIDKNKIIKILKLK